jgi:hypothetical protein
MSTARVNVHIGHELILFDQPGTMARRLITELLGLADQFVLGGVDVDVGERGVRVHLPETRHGLLQPEVEELRHLVVVYRAAGSIFDNGEVGAVYQRVRQAAERPRVVDPEVLSSVQVYTLQFWQSTNEQSIHGMDSAEESLVFLY